MTDASAGRLTVLAKAGKWDELDQQWQAAVESSSASKTDLLTSLEVAVKAKKTKWAETSAWAWLSQFKQNQPPQSALSLARQLLLRLEDGVELRQEVLELYRKIHGDVADLDTWIKQSGIEGSGSIRKALRFLDVGVHVRPGAFLMHRIDEQAAEILEVDLASDTIELRTGGMTRSMTPAQVVEEFQPAADDDFRVLRQLRPDSIRELAQTDPLRLVIGILRARPRHTIDRDELKVLLTSRILDAAGWSDWWTKLRNAVKKSPHVTIEGRSPMVLVYHEQGKSLEEESYDAFAKSASPREHLSALEGYLRECKERNSKPDAGFIKRVYELMSARIERTIRHEPHVAFSMALVIERLAQEGLDLPQAVHGQAVRMLAASNDPAAMILAAPDVACWPLALACARQAFPDEWPTLFARLLPLAPASQCEALARGIEESGRGPELLGPVIEQILAEPTRYTEALMWLWNEPSVKTPLNPPPPLDFLTRILGLVSANRKLGATSSKSVNALRAAVRSGLSSRDYAVFRRCLEGQDEAMGVAIRRLVERADGLGPVVQDEMHEIVRGRFPKLFMRAKVEPWDDDEVLYVTADGLRRKEAERDELVNVKMRENAIAIGRAAELGDLSENSEYKFALEERDLLRARLAQINMELALAKVLEPAEIPVDHIGIGHIVHMRTAAGSDRSFTILGPWESDPTRDVYSYQAPITRRLLGKSKGDKVELPVRDGDGEETYAIESFEPAL